MCTDPVNDVMLRVVPDPVWSTSSRSQVVSIDRLKVYLAPGVIRPPEEGRDIEMSGDEFVENVSLPISDTGAAHRDTS